MKSARLWLVALSVSFVCTAYPTLKMEITDKNRNQTLSPTATFTVT
jgi:hypothetical protein